MKLEKGKLKFQFCQKLLILRIQICQILNQFSSECFRIMEKKEKGNEVGNCRFHSRINMTFVHECSAKSEKYKPFHS